MTASALVLTAHPLTAWCAQRPLVWVVVVFTLVLVFCVFIAPLRACIHYGWLQAQHRRNGRWCGLSTVSST